MKLKRSIFVGLSMLALLLASCDKDDGGDSATSSISNPSAISTSEVSSPSSSINEGTSSFVSTSLTSNGTSINSTSQDTRTATSINTSSQTSSSQQTTSTSEATNTHYTITWDVGGVITTEDYASGSVPVFKGNTTRTDDAQYSYTFTGWSPEIKVVTGDTTYVAQYSSSINHYIITWSVAGQTTTEEYSYGETPTYKGNPNIESNAQYTYSFTGWSPAIQIVTGNATYEAQYSSTVNQYVVTWDVDGDITTETYSYGDIPSFKRNTEKEGDAQYTHTFTGWSPVLLPVTENATYVAQYSTTVNHYTVSWNIDGNITTEDYAYGETPSYKDGTPVKSNDAQYSYSFEEWSPGLSAVTINVTYNAVFSQSLEKAKIIFDLNGGTSASDSSPIYKSTINSTGFFFDCVKEGLNFRGWSYNGVKVFDEKGIQLTNPDITDTMIFVAEYSNTVKISVETNINLAGLITGQGEYSYNSYVDLFAHPNQGYVFVGWYNQDILLSSNEDYSYMAWTADVTFEARFSLDSYTMSIHTNNEDYGLVKFSTNQNYLPQYEENREYTSQITIVAYTKTSVRFLGWYNTNNQLVSTNAIYSFVMPNYNYALEAKWNYFTISYNLGSGENNPANPGYYTVDDDVINLCEPIKAGYDFLGWRYLGEYITSIQPTWLKNIELTAVWDTHTYSVLYELNGGTNNPSNISSYTILDETFVFQQPSRHGYTFSGWYLDSEFSESITQISIGSYGDLTLYAKWTPVVYSITYFLNNGNNVKENLSSYTIESSFQLYPAIKPGYVFKGWFDSNEHQITSIVPGSTGPISLYAHWEPVTCVVSLDPNGGDVSTEAVLVRFNESYSLPIPTRTGYTFDGWGFMDYTFYDDEWHSFTIMVDSSGTWSYAHDLSLKAFWTAINYDITYELNGGTNNQSNPSTYTIEDNLTLRNPTKTGYIFQGWFDENEEQVTSISTGSTGNINVEAIWSPNLNNLTVVSDNELKGVVTINSGNGYSSEPITVIATPLPDCVFLGWYHDEVKVSNEAIYSFTMPTNDYSLVAHFLTEEEDSWNKMNGVTPEISADEKTVTYGLYPQTIVSNEELISELNELTTIEANGWYHYEGVYYAKTIATPNEQYYKFSNKTSIVRGETYWFKCERIVWNVLRKNSNEYLLLSNVLLEPHRFNESYYGETNGHYANNYEYSEIRNWLNNDFYNSCFYLNDKFIETSHVNNSNTTTMEYTGYVCNNTLDKVFLLSYKDYVNSDYGFDTRYHFWDEGRYCKITDWAKARGGYSSEYDTSAKYAYNGWYWTRTPCSEDSRGVQFSFAAGDIGGYEVDAGKICVRPAIKLKLN